MFGIIVHAKFYLKKLFVKFIKRNQMETWKNKNWKELIRAVNTLHKWKLRIRINNNKITWILNGRHMAFHNVQAIPNWLRWTLFVLYAKWINFDDKRSNWRREKNLKLKRGTYTLGHFHFYLLLTEMSDKEEIPYLSFGNVHNRAEHLVN